MSSPNCDGEKGDEGGAAVVDVRDFEAGIATFESGGVGAGPSEERGAGSLAVGVGGVKDAVVFLKTLYEPVGCAVVTPGGGIGARVLHGVVAYGDVLRHQNLGLVVFVVGPAKTGESVKVLPDGRGRREEGDDAGLAAPAFKVGGSGVGSGARIGVEIDVDVPSRRRARRIFSGGELRRD